MEIENFINQIRNINYSFYKIINSINKSFVLTIIDIIDIKLNNVNYLDILVLPNYQMHFLF